MDNLAEALKFAANQADKLRDLDLVEVGGRQYTFRDLKPVLDPQPAPISMTTLTGLVDYCKANVDRLELASCLIQVDSPTQVSLRSPLIGAFRQRDVYAVAKHEGAVFTFDEFLDHEEFVIGLNSLFVITEAREKLATVVAAVTVQAGADIVDDGTSQTVTVQSGARLVKRQELEPRVRLRPYCTFMEIEQPAREFLFRLSKSGSPGLFVADGNLWMGHVVADIKTWLVERLPDMKIIA